MQSTVHLDTALVEPDVAPRPATTALRPLADSSDTPLHHRVKTAVAETIDLLNLGHGQRVWTEGQLSTHYDVSRSVIRQALVQLVREGRLTSRRGAGHFVNQRRTHKHLPVISSITADLAASGEPYAMTLLDVGASPHRGSLEADVASSSRLRRVHRIRRVGVLHGEPVALLSGAYPMTLSKVLTRRAVAENGVYRTLQAAGYVPTHADVSMSVEFASADEAVLLGIPDGAPLVCIQCRMRDEEGRLIEVTRELYRTDRFEFRYAADISDARPGFSAMTKSAASTGRR